MSQDPNHPTSTTNAQLISLPPISPSDFIRAKFQDYRDGLIDLEEVIDAVCTADPIEVVRLIDALLTYMGTSNDDKGKHMEGLVDYLIKSSQLFSTSSISANTKPDHQYFEIDHQARFRKPYVEELVSMYGARGKNFANLLIGESKNHKSPINTTIVFKHSGIKHLESCHLGVIFCRSGATGDEFRASQGVINLFFQSSDHVTLIFDDDDWIWIRKHPKSFGALLFRKFSEFQKSLKANFKAQ